MASERAEFRQIVEKFYAKSLQIVLQSRIPAFASRTPCGEDLAANNFMPSLVSTDPIPNGCCFNLAPAVFGPALEALEHWCTGTLEPVVVDILVSHKTRPLVAVASPKQVCKRREGKSPILRSLEKHANLSAATSSPHRIVLERWFVRFVGPSLKGNLKANKATELKDGHYCGSSGKAGCSHKGLGKGLTYLTEPLNVTLKARAKAGRAPGNVEIGGLFSEIPLRTIESATVYKEIVIMLRSLYSTARLLPAHNLFRLACTSQRYNFSLTHRILVSPPPLSESEEKHMAVYKFKPIDSHYGRMCLSVAYRHMIPFTPLETSSPMLTQIIPDYVSSPATDPLKRISNDYQSEGPLEKREMHLTCSPESGSSLRSCGCDNSGGIRKVQAHNPMVIVYEKGGCTTVPINEGHLCNLLPAKLSIKSGGHSFAEDEELTCPFAIDMQCDRMDTPGLSAVNHLSSSAGCERLSHKISQNAAVGTLVRMLTAAAPLQRMQQSSSSSPILETSWNNADGDFKHLSDNVRTLECDMSIRPVGETECFPNKTTADALEELKLYKKLRDSLLS